MEIIGITPRIPIYRPPNQGGGNRAGAIRFRTTPDHSKVKLTISRVAGSSGRARFKDDKETIEVTSAGDTDVRFYGKENSDIKKNINIQILVGNVVGAETTISVRTWVAGFKRLAVTPDQGELVFNYSWWSESGTAQTPFLADLDAIVIIGEIVRYPVPLPNPPFLHLLTIQPSSQD